MTCLTRTPRALLLLATVLCCASCGDTASDDADGESAIVGTYVLDARYVAEQMLEQRVAALKSDEARTRRPDGSTRWQSWTEEQRKQAVRNVEEVVRWQWLEGFSVELRLDVGGGYTHITRTRQSVRSPDVPEGPASTGEATSTSLPPLPPAEFRRVEQRATGTWALEGTTLWLRPETLDGKAVPPEDARPFPMTLEDGVLRQEGGRAVLIHRKLAR